jgi:hypothetical protein
MRATSLVPVTVEMDFLLACVTFVCHLTYPRPVVFVALLAILVPWKNADWSLANGLVQILHDTGLVCNAIGHIRRCASRSFHERTDLGLE